MTDGVRRAQRRSTTGVAWRRLDEEADGEA
jgi:hypothetical protein